MRFNQFLLPSPSPFLKKTDNFYSSAFNGERNEVFQEGRGRNKRRVYLLCKAKFVAAFIPNEVIGIINPVNGKMFFFKPT